MNANLNLKWDIEVSFDVPEDYFMALDFSLKEDKKASLALESSNNKFKEFNTSYDLLF